MAPLWIFMETTWWWEAGRMRGSGVGTYVAEEPPSSSGSGGKIREFSWTVTGLGVKNTKLQRKHLAYRLPTSTGVLIFQVVKYSKDPQSLFWIHPKWLCKGRPSPVFPCEVHLLITLSDKESPCCLMDTRMNLCYWLQIIEVWCW